MYVQKLNENNNSTNPSHNSNNSQSAATRNLNQQPRLGSQNKKDSSQNVNTGGSTHYDPSQRQSTKRRPAPIKQSTQLRKQSEQEDQQIQNKPKLGMLSDAAIIKNSDLQQLKSGFREVTAVSKGEESIYALAGLSIVKQQTAQVVQPPKSLLSDSRLETYQQKSPMKNEPEQLQFSSPLQFQAPPNNNKNVHSISIVGQNLQIAASNNTVIDKELRQKQYQDELQRQIRERDQIRQREIDGGDLGGRRRPGSLSRKNTNIENGSANNISEGTGRIQFDVQPQNHYEQQMMSSDKYVGQKLRDINQELNAGGQTTFYPKDQKNSMQYQANSTKMDFPNIMTRGKVVDNRIDLELEARGSIFQGRDEKTILIRKKEDSQQAIKEALQKQIDEKNRKKEEEKAKNLQYELREEQRLAQELNPGQIDLIAGRKTQYNNHHQFSIVGSGGGGAGGQSNQDMKLPDIDQIRSPQNNNERGSPMKEQMYQEENVFRLGHGHGQNDMSPVIMRQEVEQVDQKSKQINDLSDMVKVLLEEQKNLKDKLVQQEIKLKDINDRPPPPSSIQDRQQLQRKQTANITKKASERVRSQNPQQPQNPKKTVQSADNKTIQARKLKEQHAIEQAKIEAIQNKIDKARKKMEEHKKEKSKVAQETRIKFGKGTKEEENNLDDFLYQDQSQDEMDYPLKEQQHVPLIGGRHKGNQNTGQSGVTHHNLSTAQPNYHQKSSLMGTPYQGPQHKGQLPATSQTNQRQNNNNNDIITETGIGGPNQRGQKAPRGVSNKTSTNNLPLSSIDQNNSRSDAKNSIIGGDQNNLGGRYKGGVVVSMTEENSQQRQSHNNSTLGSKGPMNKLGGGGTNETVFNLDNDGVSQLTYPVEEGQFYYPQNGASKNYSHGIDPSENGYRIPTTNTSQHNYNIPYDAVSHQSTDHNMNLQNKYQQAYSQQNQFRGGKQTHTDFIQEIHNSKEFIGGRGAGAMGGVATDFISKNPSTAAGSYLHGIGGIGGGGFGQGMNSGGGDFGYGQINDSFDLETMMPPDINSIDSDLSKDTYFFLTLIDKLGAMTPTPMQNNLGWGLGDNSGIGGLGYDFVGVTVSDFGGPSSSSQMNNNGYNGGYQKYTQYGAQINQNQNQNYNQQMGNNVLNIGGIPNGGGLGLSQFDDSGSIYDSKYSPSRGGGGGSQYNRDMYGTRGTNVNNRTTITNN